MNSSTMPASVSSTTPVASPTTPVDSTSTSVAAWLQESSDPETRIRAMLQFLAAQNAEDDTLTLTVHLEEKDDPERRGGSVKFPLLRIPKNVAASIIRKDERLFRTPLTEGRQAYLDRGKVVGASFSAPAHIVHNRTISSRVQTRHAFIVHACDLLVRPLMTIGSMDVNASLTEFTYTLTATGMRALEAIR